MQPGQLFAAQPDGGNMTNFCTPFHSFSTFMVYEEGSTALLPAHPWLHLRLEQHHPPKESIMDNASQASIVHNSNVANYIATEPLARDKTQSDRLHEPAQILSSTDPITGLEIDDLTGHPYLVDGNVTMYFENEASRQEFMDMPIDHPFHLVDNPTDEGYDEG
jgi:YHS domain-containing protein